MNQPKAVISLHVSSMKQSGQLVAAMLREIGFSVWMCFEVSVGAEYREELQENIKKADVIIMLLNKHWAYSEGFKLEYSLALHLHGGNKPIISVTFADFVWKNHPFFSESSTSSSSAATCNNMVNHDAENLITGSFKETLDSIKNSVLEIISPNAMQDSASAISSSSSFSALNQETLKAATDDDEKCVDLAGDEDGNDDEDEDEDDEDEDEDDDDDDNKEGDSVNSSKKNIEHTENAEELHLQAEKYRKGEGVEIDLKKAVKIYKKASNLGYLKSTFELAKCYEHGKGVKKSLVKAMKLCAVAGGGGLWSSVLHLGTSASFPNNEYKEEIYNISAKNGDVSSLYFLAYLARFGPKKNMKKGIKLLQQGAEMNHAPSISSLAQIYMNGAKDSVKQDIDKGKQLFEKASNLGYSVASYNLATEYHSGINLKEDRDKAKELYILAELQDRCLGVLIHNSYGFLYENGYGRKHDVKKALEFYLSAIIESKNAYSKSRASFLLQQQLFSPLDVPFDYFIGVKYEDGIGAPKDYKKAVEYYEKAADKGSLKATFKLGKRCGKM
eukprot:TRINITY_DN870_c0_g1_i3.p1 TRINITY_DN870_c0_g1~~TRINITY_DN870_c0_g1_i3.p1  ORF type:complete len:557 (-),score=171.73 TRINITY_DN870_c0_g1_i3:674-2344(-)